MSEPTATILVVDDTETMRYVVASWLRRAGYHVVEASTGEQALQLATDMPVDLVMLDVGLPDVSGYEVCERIKADPRTQSVPVIHVSATAVQLADRTQGLHRGADAYLTEPVEPDEMLATVTALLRYYRARRRAEQLATRLARLAEATLAVNGAGTLPDLLRRAATGAAAIFERPAAVAASTPDGRPLVAHCRAPGAEPTVAPWSGPVDGDDQDSARGTTVQTQDASAWPVFAEDGGAPGGGGSLWVGVCRTKHGRPPAYVAVPATGMKDDDAHILTQYGQALALAVEAMRSYDEERRTALILQHSLLPGSLPSIDGIDLAVRYVPASDLAEIGGDFYELLALDGQLVAAIGDVAGHSLHAATVMGELRHVLRAYVSEGHAPAETLRRVNTLMMRLLPDESATVCLMALELATGRMTVANAGHLPPLISVPGQGARFVEGRVPMLGLSAVRAQEAVAHLPPGATAVFVTDGLVERRDVHIWACLEQLRRAVETVEPDLEAFCDRLLREFRRGSQDDDVAIVAVRRAAAPP